MPVMPAVKKFKHDKDNEENEVLEIIELLSSTPEEANAQEQEESLIIPPKDLRELFGKFAFKTKQEQQENDNVQKKQGNSKVEVNVQGSVKEIPFKIDDDDDDEVEIMSVDSFELNDMTDNDGVNKVATTTMATTTTTMDTSISMAIEPEVIPKPKPDTIAYAIPSGYYHDVNVHAPQQQQQDRHDGLPENVVFDRLLDLFSGVVDII
ncbi:hypothetical protein V1514DRAFT_51722 [Lipomyces japonicus]|uniref:uncharacterized protein n=1 Tax=Lipomyces japonicus TaxID=56871 RepID=UPI0034CD4FC3